MKFSLPKATLQRVNPTPAPRPAPKLVEASLRRSHEAGRVELDPAHFEHGFAVEEPGSLGPYAPALTEIIQDEVPLHQDSGMDPLIYPSEGWGGRGLAGLLTDRCLASPGAWLIGRQMTTTTASQYMGVANYLRCHGQTLGLAWGRPGWIRPEGRLYEERLERLGVAIERTGGDIERALREAGDAQVKEVLWATYRAAWATGDVQTFDSQLRGRPLGWEEARETLMAMRMFTEEQVNFMAPWKSLNSIRSEMNEWWREGLIDRHPREEKLGIWRVTPKAVSGGVQAGLLEAWEGESRLSIRATQELHDLAVGDTLILAAIQVAKMGGQIEQVHVEPPVRKKGVHYPDLSLSIRIGNARTEVEIEVVGTGGGYHGKGKRTVIKKSGYRAVVPGFDGKGVRYA